jgi:HD-GYP domain-containing protein (c-di-GMP phosphodiesterase class II)
MIQPDLTIDLNQLMLALSDLADLANPVIAQHQQRTAMIAGELAKAAGVSPRLTANIYAAALLHDLGALSVEEKTAVHRFEAIDPETHCIRGSILLANTSWFKQLAPIVRYHHTPWRKCQDALAEPVAFAAQTVFLADYVERLVDRQRYILHQHEEIIETIRSLRDDLVQRRIVDLFLEISKSEKFWLDLGSSRLGVEAPAAGVLAPVTIDLKGFAAVSEFCRDIIDFKSGFTATHTAGVAAGVAKMAQLSGLTALEVELLKIAGNLHDIGKMAIPNAILEKPGRLTTAEFAVIKSHTYYTYHFINAFGGLQPVARWAAYHHEKLNGAGYPFHICAEELDEGSRMMAVADIFTAVAEDRPYRKGMGQNAIFKLLRDQTDQKALDASMVELLFDHYETIKTCVAVSQAKAGDYYRRLLFGAGPDQK